MTTREKVEEIVRQEGGCVGFYCNNNDSNACPFWRFNCEDLPAKLAAARKWLAEHPEESPAESGDIAKLRQIAAGSCRGFDCGQCPLHKWKIDHDQCHSQGKYSSFNLPPETIAEAVRRLHERGEQREGGPCTAHVAPMSEIAYMQGILGRTMSQGINLTIREFSSPTSQTLVEKRRETRRRLLGL